jgi:hypothetical protein
MAKGLQGTKQVIYVKSDGWENCRLCMDLDINADFGEQINHYLSHGYKLLHVGAETARSDKGDPWHYTVAILGK